MRFTRRSWLQLAGAFACLPALRATSALAADITIAGIVFQQDQYFRGVQFGMEAAAKAASATLLSGNSDSKLEKETQLIDTYIARRVNAIVVAPLSKDGSKVALEKARKAGVNVVTYGTTVNGDIAQCSVVSSDHDIGATTGKAAKDFFTKLGQNGKVKIAVLAFKSQLAEQSDARVNGFLDEVKDEVDVVAQQDAWLAEKAIAVASDILTAHPDVQAIYAANEGGTVGAVQAVKKAGLENKVFVFGTDGSKQLGNMLLEKDNILQAVTAQQPLEVGRLAVEAATKLATGASVEKSVNVPVLGLERSDPAGVQKFLDDIKKLQ